MLLSYRNFIACSGREYSASNGDEIDEKMSASSFITGYKPGKVGFLGWTADGTETGEWIEYDTSQNPRLVVESRTLPPRSRDQARWELVYHIVPYLENSQF